MSARSFRPDTGIGRAVSEGSETVTFAATVDERGMLHPEGGKILRGRLSLWRGRKVTVSVRRYVKSKTNEQLAFFHGPVLEAWSDHCGYDVDEMKRELKLAFLAPKLAVSRLTGEEVKELPSLADLSSEEMSVFLERVLREGRTMGIEFPLDMAS